MPIAIGAQAIDPQSPRPMIIPTRPIHASIALAPPHTSTRHGALTLTPSARAEERSFRRIRAAHCLSEASLRGPRLKRAPQVARSEAEGHAQWGRLFFAYFLLAKQKKVSRLPGRVPASGLNKTCNRRKGPAPSPQPSPGGRGSKTGSKTAHLAKPQPHQSTCAPDTFTISAQRARSA